MKLRPYQEKGKQDVYSAWRGDHHPPAKVVMLRMPTGAGKTPTFSSILSEEPGASCVMAHRSELVVQASLAMAHYEMRHRIIGPPELQRLCSTIHLADVGVNYVNPSARCAVAGVDTLRRMSGTDPWFASVRKWVCDEGHHLLAENKWGKCANMFPNALGLAVTATPGRPDGKGLGRSTDGLADVLVHGPEMRWLIKSGYLTDYKIYGVPSDVDYSDVEITGQGDYSHTGLAKAVHKSGTIVGDVVKHYLRIAPGKLGITFCVDVDAAVETARAYRAAGVRAEVITGETPPLLRAQIMKRFRNREILQLVNVDILGEGVDVPAVEVVSMVRKTASFIVFCQQFGRMLRLFLSPILQAAWDTYTDAQRVAFILSSDKPFGILIDHVGNVDPERGGHGLPDAPKDWHLGRRERRSRGTPLDVDPVRTCLNPDANGTGIVCMNTYKRVLPSCPECGHVPVPVSRAAPEHVDGDLGEYGPELLARLRGDIEAVDSLVPTINEAQPPAGQAAAKKRHWDRLKSQALLRALMATWGGWRAREGDTVPMTQRRFFYTFRIDVMTAQTLGPNEADALMDAIEADLTKGGIAV